MEFFDHNGDDPDDNNDDDDDDDDDDDEDDDDDDDDDGHQVDTWQRGVNAPQRTCTTQNAASIKTQGDSSGQLPTTTTPTTTAATTVRHVNSVRQNATMANNSRVSSPSRRVIRLLE